MPAKNLTLLLMKKVESIDIGCISFIFLSLKSLVLSLFDSNDFAIHFSLKPFDENLRMGYKKL
jgi:hypothetical protein